MDHTSDATDPDAQPAVDGQDASGGAAPDRRHAGLGQPITGAPEPDLPAEGD